jgi:hypothetical protein
MNEPALQHDWVIERGSELFGLVGYPSGTYLCYGSGHFWIPITVETFGFVTLVVSFLVCCAWWCAYRRGDENAA